MVCRSLFLACFLVAHAFTASSQDRVVSVPQAWIQSYHEAKVSDRWTVLLDGGFRWRDGLNQKSAYIIRGGMGYSVSSKIRLAAGFANLGFYGDEKVIRHEFRPYQEASYKTTWGAFGISQRLRIEERYFVDRVSEFENTSFNFRFRYSIMLGIPLANLSAKNSDRKLILNIGDELFLNAGTEISSNVFDQNRAIFSPTIQWDKSLSISLTYNHQLGSTLAPDSYTLSQVIWLQLRHTLDFRSSLESQ